MCVELRSKAVPHRKQTNNYAVNTFSSTFTTKSIQIPRNSSFIIRGSFSFRLTLWHLLQIIPSPREPSVTYGDACLDLPFLQTSLALHVMFTTQQNVSRFHKTHTSRHTSSLIAFLSSYLQLHIVLGYLRSTFVCRISGSRFCDVFSFKSHSDIFFSEFSLTHNYYEMLKKCL